MIRLSENQKIILFGSGENILSALSDRKISSASVVGVCLDSLMDDTVFPENVREIPFRELKNTEGALIAVVDNQLSDAAVSSFNANGLQYVLFGDIEEQSSVTAEQTAAPECEESPTGSSEEQADLPNGDITPEPEANSVEEDNINCAACNKTFDEQQFAALRSDLNKYFTDISRLIGNTKSKDAALYSSNRELQKFKDNELRNYVVEQFCNATGTDIDTMTADPECMTELSEVIEKTKKQLTARETVKVPVSYGGEKQIIEVTRDTFDSLTESLLQKTVSLVNAMLSKENLTIDVVDEIILVGGSTYMPQVTKCLEATYGKPLFSFEPNEAVAKGAALMAAFSYDLGQDGSEQGASANPADPADPTAPQPQGDEKGFSIIDKSGKTIVVEDIINKSYGVKVYDPSQNKYFISNILIAGTAKPCSGKLDNIVTGGATHITVCETDEKDSIVEYDEAFDVYSGPLNFPAGLPGDTPAEVHFNLDMSGILSIKVLAADTETDLVFDPTTGGATKEGLETAQKLQLGC